MLNAQFLWVSYAIFAIVTYDGDLHNVIEMP